MTQPNDFTDQQLQAYLDESLSSPLMSSIESALRNSSLLRERLLRVAASREAGVHGLGEIWRRHRLSCPSRQQLGAFLLGAMDAGLQDYIRFHLDVIQCRYCLANLEDLKKQSKESQTSAESRRRKYFQTSAGYLSKNRSND
jgi:hypothetical protein